MHNTAFTSHLSKLLLGAGIAVSAGCIEGTVGLSLNLPTMSVDVDSARVALEEKVCQDQTAFNCGVLADLDAVDGEQQLPFSLPESMPTTLRLSQTTVVDVPTWFADIQRRDGAIVNRGIDAFDEAATWIPSQLIPLDLDADAFGQLTPTQLDKLTIQRAQLEIGDNDLTIDLPAIDVYLGTGLVTLEDGQRVPADRGAALHIAQSAPHPAGIDGDADIEFASGAVTALINAMQSEDPWIELVAVNDVVTLLPGSIANTLRRPGGNAQLGVQLRVGIPVSISDVMTLSSTATEPLDDL